MPKRTARRSPAPGHAIVQDNRSGQVSYWQEDYNQSAADRNGVSTADYIHVMYGFLRQTDAKDVLMIGCGGGTLASMLYRSGVTVTVVDRYKLSFDIARDYFHMPAEILRKVADGLAYLKKHPARHDALVLDAFGAEGMPEKFQTPEFFRLVKQRLKRGGLFLMNIIVEDDDDPVPRELARLLRRELGAVKLLDVTGWKDRNAVLAAGAARGLKKPKLLMAPSPGAAKLKRELALMKFRAP